MSRHHASRLILAATAALVSSGCGGANRPVPVKGVVTLDGLPVSGATVSFLPESGTGHPANALTDRSGAFRLTTLRKGDGAFPGAYRVVVTKVEPRVPDGPQWTEFWDDERGRKKSPVRYYGMLEASARQPRKPLIPAVYGDPARTPLSRRVLSSNKMRLQLHSKP